MKEKIKEFALGMGVDDVGIVALKDYTSSRSPDLQTIFPGAKSLIVLAYKELSNCESENMQIATGGEAGYIGICTFFQLQGGAFLGKGI